TARLLHLAVRHRHRALPRGPSRRHGGPVSEFADGYEGVTHAGLAVVALETGQVLLAQRTFDESDDPAVQESWEFPGGGLDEGEDPQAGAIREFTEEVGPLPEGEIVDGWRAGPEENYQGFVYVVSTEAG